MIKQKRHLSHLSKKNHHINFKPTSTLSVSWPVDIEFTFLQPYLSREDEARNFRIWDKYPNSPFYCLGNRDFNNLFFFLAVVSTDPLSTIHPLPFTIQSEGLRGSPARKWKLQEEEIASSLIHDDRVNRYTNIHFIVCLSYHLWLS